MSDRPKPGAVEDRTAPIGAPAVDGRRLRGRIPVGIESRDMGGWREVIDPGALDGANLDDLIATREHDRSKLLGRHPTTLTVESRDDGLHWAVELPDSPAGEDVRVAVERGDLRGSSWRQVVARDYWDGDVRHIAEISRLLDVTVTAAPAYAAAAAELRSQPDPATGQEDSTMAETAENTETATAVEPNTEDRAQPVQGGLRVEDNVTVTNEPARGLADEFRAAGFPGELATLSWQEYEDRAVTWTGSVDNVNKARGTAGPLGYDQRYVWPVVPRVGVDGGVTSVDVFTQSARSLATAANVVRAISAVTDKPESGSTLTIVTTPLHQVATVQSGIPNIYLETQGFSTHDRERSAARALRWLGQARAGQVRRERLPSPGHRQHPRFDSQVHHDAARGGLRAGHLGAHAGDGRDDRRHGQRHFGRHRGLRVRAGPVRARDAVRAPAAGVQDGPRPGRLRLAGVREAVRQPGVARAFRGGGRETNTSLVRLETTGVFGVERQNAAVRIAAA
jgi:HK97 family phage prohead protease